jgi:predicted histone-like DNA-binding protein
LIIQVAIVGYLAAKQSLKCLLKGFLATLTHNRKDMYAKYDFRKKPSSKEDEQPLYPRIVSNGTIDFQQIVKEIAQASSFTPADIEGVQLAIENKISEYLVSGHHVQLGNLGYFSAKLKARPVMDAKEIHAQSIYFDNVNFRPSSSFRKKVRGFVEKAKSGFAHSAEVPVEERRRRLERFLDERPMIRRKEYTQLTGLLKNKALNELNGWVKEGVLDTIGSGSHKIYVRANTKKE